MYVSTNYFSTTEKVNLKLSIIIIRKSFTYCIDEKITELSNTFGT